MPGEVVDAGTLKGQAVPLALVDQGFIQNRLTTDGPAWRATGADENEHHNSGG